MNSRPEWKRNLELKTDGQKTGRAADSAALFYYVRPAEVNSEINRRYKGIS